MRDSYAPNSAPAHPAKFPTPDEIRKRHAALVAPRVNAVVAAIREAVEKSGAQRTHVYVHYEYADRDLISATVEPSGWVLTFNDDQRDGQSIEVSPR